MNKEVLIERVNENGSFATKAEAERFVNLMIGLISEELIKGNDMVFRNFGTFSVVTRSARRGRNPRTGEIMDIPACKSVKFAPGKELAERVRAVDTLGHKLVLERKKMSRTLDEMMKEFKDRLTDFGKRSESVGDEAKKSYKETMEKVKPIYDDTRRKLKEFGSQSGDALAELKTGFERAYGELKEAFKKAKEKM